VFDSHYRFPTPRISGSQMILLSQHSDCKPCLSSTWTGAASRGAIGVLGRSGVGGRSSLFS